MSVLSLKRETPKLDTYTLSPALPLTPAGQVSFHRSMYSPVKQGCQRWLSTFLWKVPGKPPNEAIYCYSPTFFGGRLYPCMGGWGIKYAVSVG